MANFRTFLFWNPGHWELRPQAQPFYDELRKVGILHDLPESAATLVNEIYDNPLDWWMEPERQSARKHFCNQFALTSDDWLRDWKNELKSLLD